MELLVTPEELASRLYDPQWLIFDCRFSLLDDSAGWRAYVSGHIPGARYADLSVHLSGPPRPGAAGRHPLPERRVWTERVRGWGIRPSVQVVAYDDAGGATASRLWWMLRWIGHAKVAVLDGGWQAWVAAGGPVTHQIPGEPEPSDHDYENDEPLARLITADALDARDQLLLDARDPRRFRGEEEPLDPVAGHIPGAACLPFMGNLNDEGRFKQASDLRRRFAPLLDEARDKPVVTYCGSGVSATHNVLAMRLAGYPEPLLYAGSWSDWISDPNRPVATGERVAE